MLSRLLALLSLALPVFSSLEDLSRCDPLKKDARCPPDAAFGGKSSFNFTSAGWNDALNDFWAVDDDSANDHHHIDFRSDGNGASLAVWADGQAPTLTSTRYLLFGRVSVELLAAQGAGLITAMVLKSDSGDEIDWELLGAYNNQAQSNYFYDGQALFNTYNDTYQLSSSSFSSFHRYSIDWSPETLVFSIDNVPRRTWRLGDIPPGRWPQTPMQVKLGVWSVDNTSDAGEVAWAGGMPQWSPGHEKKAYFRSLDVEDRVGLCNQTEEGAHVEYLYDERTHGWAQVQIRGCQKRSPVPLPTRTTAPIATGNSSGSDPARPTQTDAGDDGDDDEGSARMARQLSSPLAAVLVLGWMLVI